ncbi:MAG TPA: ABC transporter ATP-binding protein [Anaerolineae bacterium]|nr:ABC transporter ATP-binding protein [Anaerolineae bacterium]
MVQYAIETENMVRIFGQVRAVDGISMRVPAGAIFGFLGPNGAGKTTTLRLLLGLLELNGGSARVLGYDVATQAASIREHTGVLLENDGLYGRLTVYDNLDFMGQVYHLPPRQRQERIRQLLEHLGLWERRDADVTKLSKGMKQSPGHDEPSAGLDPVAAVALRQDIQNLARQEGTTVFLTTHNLAEAERICDLVGVIRKGQLLALAAPSQLRDSTSGTTVHFSGQGFSQPVLDRLCALPFVRSATVAGDQLQVELGSGGAVPELVALLVQEGVQIDEVHKGSGSLEEAFVTLMQENQERGGEGLS